VTRHAERTNSIDPANRNVLATGRNHRRFIFEFERLSTSTADAFFADLGECIFSLQILDKPVAQHPFS
jgi:hypothetical protein